LTYCGAVVQSLVSLADMPDQKKYRVAVAHATGFHTFHIHAADYHLDQSNRSFVFTAGAEIGKVASFPTGTVLAIIEESAIAS
jgi:hypothetical protein